MADTVDCLTRSAIMRCIKSRDTSPEMAVRRALHASGLRFRLHRQDLPGTPDLVLPRHRIAVFVHGCFWHWHGCRRCRMPQSNRAYWSAKIARNVARDQAASEALRQLGWRVLVVWECELQRGIEACMRAAEGKTLVC